MTEKRVLIVGLEPELVDLTDPAVPAGLTAAKIRGALETDATRLRELGYAPTLCLIDRGETAKAVVTEQLAGTPYECVLVGAGVRTLAAHFRLFETLVNVIHIHAPQAKLCFNTNPSDTAEAVQRWI